MVIGARKGSAPLDAVSTLQADSFIHTRRRRNTPTTMAGHRAVFLALTLVTWLPWLQQTTGQEVSSVEEIVKTCTGRDVQSLCDPEGILTEEEELEIRRSLNDIERTSFARNIRICASPGQRLNATVVILPDAPTSSTSSKDREDQVNSLIQALLPDRTICRLLAIFVLRPPTVHWTLRTGSDVSHEIHRSILNMATGNDRLESVKQSLYDVVDDMPEQPYYLPRGVAGFGKPNGGGNVANPIGWEGDWSTMLYIGIGLGAIILILAIFVCCVLHQRKKQERVRRAQIEAASGVMIPVADPGVPVVLKPPA
ncbi:uncharacterized protein [Branchiostoma lanceolatum]|uniref:uncharacterized protein isoform X3 n=1 Tax=Branchiostoma lanceolatum TaxID=7740 RepID=UPI003454BB1E